MKFSRQIGSLGEVLLDQAIRGCCIDRLSWQRLSELIGVCYVGRSDVVECISYNLDTPKGIAGQFSTHSFH
jgi:hypothetical protein